MLETWQPFSQKQSAKVTPQAFNTAGIVQFYTTILARN